MNESLKVVAIDFDDTLCLTEEACFRMENFVADQLGFLPQSREIHLRTWGQQVESASAVRFPGINTREFKFLLDKVMPEFIKRGELDEVSEENYQALDKIRAAGKKLVVVTSRSEAEVRHLIYPEHPLSLRIDAFYHGDNTEYLKPDPRVFSAMLARFKITPRRQCISVIR
jgi:phosphoglycolate phosphatase